MLEGTQLVQKPLFLKKKTGKNEDLEIHGSFEFEQNLNTKETPEAEPVST